MAVSELEFSREPPCLGFEIGVVLLQGRQPSKANEFHLPGFVIGVVPLLDGLATKLTSCTHPEHLVIAPGTRRHSLPFSKNRVGAKSQAVGFG